jgi:beta-lactamase class A
MTTRAFLAAGLLLVACAGSSANPPTPTRSSPVVVVTRVAGVAATRPSPASARPAHGARPTAAPAANGDRTAPIGRPRFPFAAPPTDGQRLDAAIAAQLGRHAAELGRDNVGVVVENVATGERFVHNGGRVFPSGSVYKLAVAWEVLRRVDAGHLRLDDELTIESGDAFEAEPAGGVQLGERITVRQALDAMMSVSSNAAAYALLRQVGRSELNASLHALGLPRTTVPVLNDPVVPSGEALHPEWAMTTPEDMASLLRRLATDGILTPGSRAELRRLLALVEPIDPLRDGSPAGSDVLAKIGSLEDATNAAGLLSTPRGAVVVSIFTTEVPPGRAHELIVDVARTVHRIYGA